LKPAEVRRLIEQGLPSAEVEVSSEDDTHFEALVVSPEFSGKRSLARHQMVYAALGERMGREIHALSLRTLTPEEKRRDGAA
jgi:acid stress-induced BolA-like protein IbaG/YrbA